MQSDEVDLSVYLAKDIDALLDREGTIGALLMTGEVEGAYPNGSVVEKVNTRDGDSYPDGTRGLVFSSIRDGETGIIGYFVLFDPEPRVPILISGERVQKVS